MPFSNYHELNEIQKDVLKEIGNIGAGNAASAISAMIDRPIDIQVPKVSVLQYAEVIDRLGGPEELMVSLCLNMSDDVNGLMLFLLHKNFAHLAINALLGMDLNDFSEIDEMEQSAIKEVGNIMAASYVNAVSTLTNLTINISVPDLSIDMVGAILSVPAIYYADISDEIIFIENEFSSHGESVSSHILLIPDVDSLKKIMGNLGIEI